MAMMTTRGAMKSKDARRSLGEVGEVEESRRPLSAALLARCRDEGV